MIIDSWEVEVDEFFSLKLKAKALDLVLENSRILTIKEVLAYYWPRSLKFKWNSSLSVFDRIDQTSFSEDLSIYNTNHNLQTNSVYFFDYSESLEKRIEEELRLFQEMERFYQTSINNQNLKEYSTERVSSTKLVPRFNDFTQVTLKLSPTKGLIINSPEKSFKVTNESQRETPANQITRKRIVPMSRGPLSKSEERLFNNNSKRIHVNEDKKFCSICYSDLNFIVARIDSCSHEFCFECLWEWSKVTNSCPLCKEEFLKITKMDSNGGTETLSITAKKAQFDDEEDSEDLIVANADNFCYCCRHEDNFQYLLICNNCNTKCCHTYCLDPPLDHIPQNEWFCDYCVNLYTIRPTNPIARIDINSRPNPRNFSQHGVQINGHSQSFILQESSQSEGNLTDDEFEVDSFINDSLGELSCSSMEEEFSNDYKHPKRQTQKTNPRLQKNLPNPKKASDKNRESHKPQNIRVLSTLPKARREANSSIRRS